MKVNLLGNDGVFIGGIDVATDMGNRLWFRFNASDPMGNVNTTSEAEVVLLSQNPVILIETSYHVLEDEAFELNLTAQDADSVSGELEWQMETDATWLKILGDRVLGVPTDDDVGMYTVNVSVVDGEGGHDWKEFILTVVDVNHPPVVEIRYPEDGIEATTTLRVSGSTSDDENAVEWVRIQVDGGEWVDADGTVQWSIDIDIKNMKPGEHQVYIKGFDGYNESDVKSVSFIVPSHDDDGTLSMTVVAVACILGAVLALGVILLVRRNRT
jgi:hypothetical protein